MKGLEYFPLCCHMDDSVKLFEADEGLEGFAVMIKLWQSIYSGEGYFKYFDSDVCLLFSKEVYKTNAEIERIVSSAIERGIFHRGLFEKYKILTSKGIQERFFKCAERRKEILVKGEYLLADPEEFSNIVTDGAKGKTAVKTKNADISDKNVNKTKQSKVKKSKAKKSKEEESIAAASASHPPEHSEGLNVKADEGNVCCFGDYKNVLLTNEEYDALKRELGGTALSEYIKRVDEYVRISGKKYKDFALVIKKWAKEDRAASQNTKSVKKSRFNNYEDTNTHDYSDFTERILKEMLEED